MDKESLEIANVYDKIKEALQSREHPQFIILRFPMEKNIEHIVDDLQKNGYRLQIGYPGFCSCWTFIVGKEEKFLKVHL